MPKDGPNLEVHVAGRARVPVVNAGDVDVQLDRHPGGTGRPVPANPATRGELMACPASTSRIRSLYNTSSSRTGKSGWSAGISATLRATRLEQARPPNVVTLAADRRPHLDQVGVEFRLGVRSPRCPCGGQIVQCEERVGEHVRQQLVLRGSESGEAVKY